MTTTAGGPATSAMADLVARYRARTPKSAALADRFRAVLPGGETRSVSYFAPYPLVIESGHRARIQDADGHTYLDVLNNYTALVHGHAFSPAVESATAALREGSVFPAPNRAQLDLAELIVGRYPAAELVRFTNSGTEAAILALRVARRITGRTRIVLFRGHYHGTAPEFSDGTADAIEIEYNDAAAVVASVDEETAAVFVEPFLGSAGVIPGDEAFLRTIERRAHEVGALFVLDEVQALRSAYNGVHGSLGLRPDLVLMGKIIGGGLPVGAVAGSHEVLSITAGDRPDGLRHSGTFNGNVATMAAGVANLQALNVQQIHRLNTAAEDLAVTIEAAGAERGLAVAVTRYGSILHVHPLQMRPRSATDAARSDPAIVAALHLALLESGVYAAPRGMLNLSTVMTEADVATIAAAYARAFDAIRPLFDPDPL